MIFAMATVSSERNSISAVSDGDSPNSRPRSVAVVTRIDLRPLRFAILHLSQTLSPQLNLGNRGLRALLGETVEDPDRIRRLDDEEKPDSRRMRSGSSTVSPRRARRPRLQIGRA